MISIKKRPNFQIKSKESVKRELEVLKEQSQLLDKIKNYLETREEYSLYYKSDEERKMAQIFKNYKNTKWSEPKNCKRRTYKQFRSERFRNLKKRKLEKDIRGIHTSEKTQQNRAFSVIWNRVFFKYETIDFEELFKVFNLSTK